ncbi:hypothetical protein DSO57_1017158 [Entomophthora muscae]|uniref:Uncharacterized protein n=1 Tax=Entomophthora muscae TaxID=34485 RepID=A0ACC2RVV0_9FUNG|nr:hypothetical protein DSO57_1017158 [Entomophthora muscae]
MHLQHLCAVLNTLWKNQLKAKPSKCKFLKSELLFLGVVNNSIHYVLISPLLGHFEDKYLTFAFDSRNELASALGNMIVWFPDSAQLTCPTHACGK